MSGKKEKKTNHSAAPKPYTKLVATTDTLEDRLRGGLFRFRLPLFVIAVTLLAFYGRTFLWPFVSGDYNECLHLWLDEIRAGQGFHSIGTQIGNYTAPYHYLMAAMTYLPGLSNLEVIKITSTIGDFCMASAAAYLCWQLTASKLKAVLAYAIILCLPTVFLNSAAWGQCDAMFTTFILLSAALLLRGSKGLSLLFYGIALAIKIQALFVLPAYVILWLCSRLRLRHFLAAVGGYVLMFIPAMIGHGSLEPLFRAYIMQTKASALASNIYVGPSLFTGVTADELDMIVGVLLPCFIIGLGVIALYCWQRKEAFTPKTEFLLIALMACLSPFLLPAMKDRYYYIGEVLCVIYALQWPRRLMAPLALQLASLPCYARYLFNGENPFGYWLVLAAALPSLLLFWDLYRHLSCSAHPIKAQGSNNNYSGYHRLPEVK